jgi:hypothetical protein
MLQRDINLRSSDNQCFAEFNQHDFHRNGLVLHPAGCLAQAYGMYDHRSGFLDLFPDGLHHLSRERRRKIFGIHRLDRGDLFSDIGLARAACFCDAAFGDRDACSGFPSPMGSAQANRALDDSDLALCLGHRRGCVFNALQVVPSGNVMPKSCTWPLVDV